MEQVIIGVDPHKLSATIEVVDQQEHLLGSGRFTTDQRGYTAMRSYVKAWPDRVTHGHSGTTGATTGHLAARNKICDLSTGPRLSRETSARPLP